MELINKYMKKQNKPGEMYKKFQIKKKNWIAGAIKNPGGLHKSLGVKAGKKISAKVMASAAKKGGKVGKQARLAETLKGFKHKKGMKKKITLGGIENGVKNAARVVGNDVKKGVNMVGNIGKAFVKGATGQDSFTKSLKGMKSVSGPVSPARTRPSFKKSKKMKSKKK